MPSEQSLRAGEEGGASGSGEESAEGSEEESIRRLPARSPRLTLKDSELMAKRQHLRTEPGVGAETDEQEVCEEADERVAEGEKHWAEGCRLAPIDRRPPTGRRPVYGMSVRGGPNRTDRGGFTAQLPAGRRPML
jgi:hypothetical protein